LAIFGAAGAFVPMISSGTRIDDAARYAGTGTSDSAIDAGGAVTEYGSDWAVAASACEESFWKV